MSKLAHIKDMGAKSSTPVSQNEEESALQPESLQDAILLDSQVERLLQIDPH